MTTYRRFCLPIAPTELDPPAYTLDAVVGTDPVQYEVTDPTDSRMVAVLTEGCRTARVLGPTRTFVEQTPSDEAASDDFDRTVVDGWGSTISSGRWTVRTGDDTDFSVTPGFGLMRIDTVNESRRIAPSSYGYNYDAAQVLVRVDTSDLALNTGGQRGDQYVGVMARYVDVDNHMLAMLCFEPTWSLSESFAGTAANGWGSENSFRARPWTVRSATAANFAVGGGVGTINLASANVTRRITLGFNHKDAFMRYAFRMPTAPTGASIFTGAMLRYKDSDNWIECRVQRPVTLTGSTTIEIRKRLAAVNTVVATTTVPFDITTSGTYCIAARIEGDRVRMALWSGTDPLTGQPAYQLDVTDADFLISNYESTDHGIVAIGNTGMSNTPTIEYTALYLYDVENNTDLIRLRLQKRLAGVTTDIPVTGTSLLTYRRSSASERYWIKVSVSADPDALVQAKAWPDSEAEPGGYPVVGSSGTLTSGDVGLRAIWNPDVTWTSQTVDYNTRFADYQVQAQWANPETITHAWWVRLLDEPFDGVTVPADWLKRYVDADDEDILSLAMGYIANAPAVSMWSTDAYRLDPPIERVYGAQWGGNASYGPRDSAGARIEGGDWNDYIGVTVNYPLSNGGTTVDPPEVDQFQCIDCSGYVRTVFGMRAGYGLQIAADWPDRFPRTSRLIADSGPGLLVMEVAGATPTDPERALVMIGDIVNFDATSDPGEEEGQIDHDGIFMGADNNGGLRFISSRKTANGPTMSDIGGASLFSGGGLYSLTLRSARRV